MKSVLKLLSRGAFVVILVGTFQISGLAAYLYMVLNLDARRTLLALKFGLPLGVILLTLFALSIPLAGRRLMSFLCRHERGHTFSDEELKEIQRKSVNFPYIVALLAFLFWVVSVPIVIIFLRHVLEFTVTDVVLGSAGGFIGGLLNIPPSVYTTNLLSRPIIDLTGELSPGIPPGGKVGLNIPLSWKMAIAFGIIIFGYMSYIGLVGYTRIVRFHSGGIFGGLGHGFAILSISVLLQTALLAILAARDITTMLGRLRNTATHISEGYVEERARVITNDEVGELAGAVNVMAQRLEQNRSTIKNVQKGLLDSAAKLMDTTGKLLTITREQAAGATEQSAAVRQITSTNEMILDTAREVAKAAGESDDAASRVLSAVKEGVRRSHQTVAGIESLSIQVAEIAGAIKAVESCAHRVGDALKVINEIASRTNLLSLNAALEAAGAGAEGQRFSIVAEQIRRLAEKSRTSSKRIEAIVEEINAATSHAAELTEKGEEDALKGVELVRNIQSSLEIINEMATASSDLARKIDLSSRQQQTSLEQASVTLQEVVSNLDETLNGIKRAEGELGEIENLAANIKSMIGEHELIEG